MTNKFEIQAHSQKLKLASLSKKHSMFQLDNSMRTENKENIVPFESNRQYFEPENNGYIRLLEGNISELRSEASQMRRYLKERERELKEIDGQMRYVIMENNRLLEELSKL